MAYGDFKNWNRRIVADKVLCNKKFNIGKNPKNDGYQCGLTLIAHKFFDEKSSGVTIKNKIISNK